MRPRSRSCSSAFLPALASGSEVCGLNSQLGYASVACPTPWDRQPLASGNRPREA
jgi:hypothetical protein